MKKAKKKTGKKAKADNYKKVTDRIVAALEAGVAPWIKPWDASLGQPRNGHSGHVYRGINSMLAYCSPFADPRFYTFNQIKKNYGESHVRKGEKGTPIIFWTFIKEKDKDGDETGKRIPLLRVYTVFNFEQVEWDEDKAPKPIEVKVIDPEAAYADAAALVERAGADLHHGGGTACYIPSMDRINMPPAGVFNTVEDYWSTMLHEHAHWTKGEGRCVRDMKKRFKDHTYAAEELVAELASAFLCEELGIGGKLQHPEYIGHWIKALKKDKYALFTAARLAKQAAEYLLKTEAKTEAKDEPTETEVVSQAA